eukprot:3940429-Rhodomonas_salina.3
MPAQSVPGMRAIAFDCGQRGAATFGVDAHVTAVTCVHARYARYLPRSSSSLDQAQNLLLCLPQQRFQLSVFSCNRQLSLLCRCRPPLRWW